MEYICKEHGRGSFGYWSYPNHPTPRRVWFGWWSRELVFSEKIDAISNAF